LANTDHIKRLLLYLMEHAFVDTPYLIIHVFLSVSGASGYGPGDKRRKPTQLSSMTYILDESDILDDLKIINKNKAFTVSEVILSSIFN